MTDQQAVTVAQIDVDAAAALDDALGFLTDIERPIVIEHFACYRHRLASVSSASAETWTTLQLKDAVTELLSHRGERPYRILGSGTALWETWVPAFRAALRYLPATTSPEPVPATNQAGEVALRAALESIARPFPLGCNWEDQARACQIVAQQALATQPATSQEGEDLESEIADAIDDSLDMDWTGSIGARHVMELLRSKGLVA